MLTAMPHHTDSSTYASPSSGPSPWQQQQQQQQLLLRADRGGHLLLPYGGEDSVATAAPPSDVQTRAPAHQRQHRAAGSARRVARRRPRPSRRLPTTYISADLAEFRRMVHQVTGADELLLPTPRPEPEEKQDHLLLPCCRHTALAPVASGAPLLLLPTLDTSAFLLGRARTTHSEAPPCDSPVAAGLLPLDNNTIGGAGAGTGTCGFPTLESWDLL